MNQQTEPPCSRMGSLSGMVGLLVSVFVSERLAPSIRAVSGERIRSGLYGQAGNKARGR